MVLMVEFTAEDGTSVFVNVALLLSVGQRSSHDKSPISVITLNANDGLLVVEVQGTPAEVVAKIQDAMRNAQRQNALMVPR